MALGATAHGAAASVAFGHLHGCLQAPSLRQMTCGPHAHGPWSMPCQAMALLSSVCTVSPGVCRGPVQAHQRLGLPTIRCRVRKANKEVLRMHMMQAAACT